MIPCSFIELMTQCVASFSAIIIIIGIGIGIGVEWNRKGIQAECVPISWVHSGIR